METLIHKHTVMYMNEYKAQSILFEHQLRLGDVELSDVVAWADNIILKSVETEEWMIDLSLCGSKTVNYAIDALNKVPGNYQASEIWPKLKLLMAKSITAENIKPETAASYLSSLAINGLVPKPDQAPIERFLLYYDCVSEGYGVKTDVDNEVMEFLIEQNT